MIIPCKNGVVQVSGNVISCKGDHYTYIGNRLMYPNGSSCVANSFEEALGIVIGIYGGRLY